MLKGKMDYMTTTRANKRQCCPGNMFSYATMQFFTLSLNVFVACRRERKFKVSIKFASKPDLHHLQQFIQGRQLDCPQETIQFFDVVLREKSSKR